MIRGNVNARHEAVVRLRVRGPAGVESDVDSFVPFLCPLASSLLHGRGQRLSFPSMHFAAVLENQLGFVELLD